MIKHFSLFTLMVLSIGCAPKPPPPSILNDLVCEPPCWQNIIPGETSEKELLSILEKLPNVIGESLVVREVSWNGFSNTAKFRLDNNNYPVYVSIYLIDGIVSLILLSENLGVSIASAISVFGEPKNIFVSYYRDYIPVLFNEEIGIAIQYNDFDVPRKLQGNIHPEIEIGTIGFFDPESFPQLLESGIFSALVLDMENTLEIVFPWDGYGNIEEKYRP